MGTVFTIDIRDAGTWDDATAEVVTWLHHVDAVFSTYRADSEIERISRGELRVADADPDVATVLELCAYVQTVTGGYFSALPARRLDPTGLVKGWAIERASELLRRHGSSNHAVNGGGDLQLAGEARRGEPWQVGIADPGDASRMVSVVAGRDCAIATSGTSERGQHIVDPFTGRAAAALASATVTGPSLTYADAYATAAFVMGLDALPWIEPIDGYSALLVTADGSVHRSSGWPAPSAPVGRPVSTSLDE
jgi:thiamine biosynthesis lipoprotein